MSTYDSKLSDLCNHEYRYKRWALLLLTQPPLACSREQRLSGCSRPAVRSLSKSRQSSQWFHPKPRFLHAGSPLFMDDLILATTKADEVSAGMIYDWQVEQKASGEDSLFTPGKVWQAFRQCWRSSVSLCERFFFFPFHTTASQVGVTF